MTKFELVLISVPAMGNLVPIVEFAELLTKHDPRFSATILIITMPQRPILNTYAQARASSTTNIRFLYLPTVDPPTPDQYQSSVGFLSLLIQKHNHHVRDALLEITRTESTPDSVRVAALFVDMFSTSVIDVAAELAIPCYLFFASPASFLGFMLHLSRVESIESLDSGAELSVPSFKNPLPRPVFSNVVAKGISWISYHAGRYRETKGVVVNTLQELEPHALQSLHCDSQLPPVYPIGPILDLDGSARWDPNPAQYKRIMAWLDQQPLSSVVLLCFGSLGSLSSSQVEQIAIGLERAGYRFLWALREPPKAQLADPTDYEDYKNVLPDGFLKRTAEIGLVCGWVPQAKVLGHKAIGGFVSHCGWNSILESLWHGVPIATWPVYAEQHMNAFEMVKELGLAVEIRLDCRVGGDLVRAGELEKGVRCLMDGSDETRRKVKETSDNCRVALMENGSSCTKLASLIEELTS